MLYHMLWPIVKYCYILWDVITSWKNWFVSVWFCLGGVLDRHHISLKLPQIGSRLKTSSTCTAKNSGNLRFSIEPTRDPMVSYHCYHIEFPWNYPLFGIVPLAICHLAPYDLPGHEPRSTEVGPAGLVPRKALCGNQWQWKACQLVGRRDLGWPRKTTWWDEMGRELAGHSGVRWQKGQHSCEKGSENGNPGRLGWVFLSGCLRSFPINRQIYQAAKKMKTWACLKINTWNPWKR